MGPDIFIYIALLVNQFYSLSFNEASSETWTKGKKMVKHSVHLFFV